MISGRTDKSNLIKGIVNWFQKLGSYEGTIENMNFLIDFINILFDSKVSETSICKTYEIYSCIAINGNTYLL